jgi:regulator of replication initiation timing
LTTTTKIFIILVCLFAFIFTPMAIQFAAQTHDWKQLAQDFANDWETAEAEVRGVKAAAASQIEHYKTLRNQVADRLQDAEDRLGELNQQLTNLTGEYDRLKLEHGSLKTASELQNATMAILARHNDEMKKNITSLVSRELDLQTRNAQLNDRVKELTAQAVVLTQQLNQKLQQMAACRDENETLRQQANLGRAGEFLSLGPSPSARASEAPARSPVRGRVKAVEGNLATIDVGSASGVTPGMTMVVMRDGDYICDLQITSEVTPSEAVGEIKRETGKRIRPDDVVVDEASFNARS